MAFRNDDPDALADANGAGKDGYTDGNPGVTAPTPVRDQDLNMIQEEICNAVDLFSGGASLTTSRDGSDQHQMFGAILLHFLTAAIDRATNGIDNANHEFMGAAVDYSNGFVDETVAVVVGDDTIGSAGEIYSSTGLKPGVTWVSETPAGSQPLRDVCVGISGTPQFIAVGEAGHIETRDKSTTNWTARTAAGSTTFNAVVSVATLGLIVAVGDSGTIETSPDAITWTARTAAGSANFIDIAWSEELGLIVAVGDSGTIETSPDAITWTARTAGSSYAGRINTVAWSARGGRFVAGTDHTGTFAVQTSTDGVTWAEVDVDDPVLGTGAIGFFVGEHEGVFIAGHAHMRWVSLDGLEWLRAVEQSTISPDMGAGSVDIHRVVSIGDRILFTGTRYVECSGALPRNSGI